VTLHSRLRHVPARNFGLVVAGVFPQHPFLYRCAYETSAPHVKDRQDRSHKPHCSHARTNGFRSTAPWGRHPRGSTAESIFDVSLALLVARAPKRKTRALCLPRPGRTILGTVSRSDCVIVSSGLANSLTALSRVLPIKHIHRGKGTQVRDY